MKKDKLSLAYPNYDQYIDFKNPRDTKKWIGAVKDMYFHIHKGLDRIASFNQVTAGWDNMEKLDFTHWLKYYEENAHKKYASDNSINIKTAQVSYWEDINRAGYFVPIQQELTVDENDAAPVVAPVDFAQEQNNQAIAEDNKREIIEAQRSKILSRLDSAEKLLRTTDGHIMAGNELASLMRAIYDLKERIHVVNKKTSSNRLYEDMIIREANIQTRRGFTNASSLLCKIAEGQDLSAAPPANPMTGAGLPGNLPGEGPGLTPPPNSTPDFSKSGPSEKQSEPMAEGMKGFLEGLDTNNFTPDADELEVHDSDDELVVEAQISPPVPPLAPPIPKAPVKPLAPKVPTNKETINNETIEIEDENPDSPDLDGDRMIDQAFSNVTISDVINKLESLAKIFKNREVPRQLAIVDLMLDKLNLASFFPTLAEAMNRSLDSNQYMSSRIEDILSRLRGTIPASEIDLKNENGVDTPEVAGLKNKLEIDDAKEKARKENRKKQEDAEVAKTTPEVEIENDLAAPTQMTNKVPLPPPPPVK